MQAERKQYTLTLRGKVQEIGFRGYAEDLCRRLGVGGIIYNVGTDTVKIICEGDEDAVMSFYKGLRGYGMAEIGDAKIEEGIQLPYPLHRVVVGIEQELYSRLDAGVRTLEGIKEDTGRLQGIQENTQLVREDIKGMREDMKGMAEDIKGTGEDIKGMAEDIKGTRDDIKGTREDLKTLSKIEKVLSEISDKL